jgi:hypothetical protein
MNVSQTMTALKIRPAFLRSVLIPVLELFVAQELFARLKFMLQFATVHQDCKEMSELLALRSNVPQMLIVLAMKNVTIQEGDKGKNVCHSVLSLDVY